MWQSVRSGMRALGVGPLVLRYVIEPVQRLQRRRLPDRGCTVRTQGFELEILSPRHNRIGEALYRTGVWEPEVTQAVRSLIKPGMNVIDVGADIGYFALLFAALAAPGKVVAFEPIPAGRALCESNLRRNNVRNATVLGCALGQESRTVVLRDPFNLSRIDLQAGRSTGTDLEVPLRRFDDLLPEFDLERVDLIKIDVEGAEHEVLRGMEQTLRRDHPILVVELHGTLLPLFDSHKAAVAEYLGAFGYRWDWLDGGAFDSADNTTVVFQAPGSADLSEKRMSISVVIATYNRPGPLGDTLRDLSAQTRPADEVIVVDQSQDEQEPNLPPLRGLRYERQSPPNAQRARNRAIREAQGDILIFVDDDVRIPPDFVANHLRSYQDHPEIDGVAGQVLEPGQAPTSVLPAWFHWPHNGWMFLPLNYAEPCAAVNWPSCNASVRREAALRVGGFDEQFVRTWYDDTDFSWRLHQAGCRIVFNPTATLVHLKAPAGGKRPGGRDGFVLADTEFWGTLFYFWRKNFGLPRVWRHVRHYLRRLVCRKVLLVRPHLLAVAVYHVGAGYVWASRRLRQGPAYLEAARSPSAGR